MLQMTNNKRLVELLAELQHLHCIWIAAHLQRLVKFVTELKKAQADRQCARCDGLVEG